MERIPKTIIKKLDQRYCEGSYRFLSQDFFSNDFFSNDYLGFSHSDKLKELLEEALQLEKLQNGATGSRLISGNFPLIDQVEIQIAKFHNAESALLFTSGYTANVGIFSCIANREDVILYDALIHASIRDGIQLSNARGVKFNHNDLHDLECKLLKNSNILGNVYVVTESVFSMDGDMPDIVKMIEICEKYNAFVIVDEAHAIGVFGDKGEGVVSLNGLQHKVLLTLVTYGKAMGGHGACVLSGKAIREYLINFCRSFIYTTGLSPHSVAHIYAGYEMLKSTEAISYLHRNINYFKKRCEDLCLTQHFISSRSSIQSVLIGGNERTKQCAQFLRDKGYGVKAILSPTVPLGAERIRICLHSYNTFDQIEGLLSELKQYDI